MTDKCLVESCDVDLKQIEELPTMVKKWVPLESNPEVLTEFMHHLGVDTTKYCFHDVFGLDEELLAMIPQPVLALLLLFPSTAATEARTAAEDESLAAEGRIASDDVFYMKQTIHNACGTIAVLHGLGNNTHTVIPEPGSFLDQFLKATSGMTPEERGRYLEDPPADGPSIEAAHQAAANEGQTAAPSADDEVDLHFICFVEHGGVLYELDGCRKGAVKHGSTSKDHFLSDCAKVIQRFIEKTQSIQFNLIALGPAL